MDQQQDVFRLVGNYLLVWAALVGTASVIVHSRVTWWHSPVGKHLMYYMVTMAAVLDLGVIKLVVGDSWSFALLRLVVFAAVPVVMTQRLIIQIRAQRDARSNAAPPGSGKPDIPGRPAG